MEWKWVGRYMHTGYWNMVQYPFAIWKTWMIYVAMFPKILMTVDYHDRMQLVAIPQEHIWVCLFFFFFLAKPMAVKVKPTNSPAFSRQLAKWGSSVAKLFISICLSDMCGSCPCCFYCLHLADAVVHSWATRKWGKFWPSSGKPPTKPAPPSTSTQY